MQHGKESSLPTLLLWALHGTQKGGNWEGKYNSSCASALLPALGVSLHSRPILLSPVRSCGWLLLLILAQLPNVTPVSLSLQDLNCWPAEHTAILHQPLWEEERVSLGSEILFFVSRI